MRSPSPFLLVLLVTALVPTGQARAEGGTNADAARAQIQAEQEKKQALSDSFRRYLGAEPGRKKRLDATADRIVSQALNASVVYDNAETTPTLLVQWQAELAPLAPLLAPAPTSALNTLNTSLKEAVGLLSTIPPANPKASPEGVMKRQQALMATASAMLDIKQQAARLDEQLEQEVRRLGVANGILATQSLMLPAPSKGEKR